MADTPDPASVPVPAERDVAAATVALDRDWSGAPMYLAAREEGSLLVVEVAGQIDMSTAPRFEQYATDQIDRHRGWPVSVDMSQVTFIDSTGLAALVELGRVAADAAIEFALRRPSARLIKLLSATHLSEVFVVDLTG